MSKLKTWPQYIVGTIVLVLIFVGVRLVTTKLRPPRSMTVLEAQAMASAQMATPAGSVPVAVETVTTSAFSPSVTYTGSVMALNDEDVSPRVAGTLVAVSVYPGDHVRAGQVVARLDSVELSSRTREAGSAEQAASQEVGISIQEREQAVAQRRTAQARIGSLSGGVRDARAQIEAAQAMQEQSRREVEAAQAGLSDAEANATAMQSDAAYWQNEIERETTLYKAGAVSKNEYQQEGAQAAGAAAKLTQAQAGIREKKAMLAAGNAKVRQAQDTVTSARAKLDQANSDLQGAHADLESNQANVAMTEGRIHQRAAMASQAGAQLTTADIVKGYTEIRAQQDGTVTERLVSPGTLVQPGSVILRIKNTSVMRVQANVPEADLAGIRVGNRVTVSVNESGIDLIEGRVTALFSAADAQSRTVIVESRILNTNGRLLPGQYAVMKIATDAPRTGLTVPLSAIRRDADQTSYVWVMAKATQHGGQAKQEVPMASMPGMDVSAAPAAVTSGSVAHRINVVLGALDGQRAAVVSGLRAGDRVVTMGNEYLSEGDPVTAVDWARDGPKTLPKPAAAPMDDMPGMVMPKPAATGANPVTSDKTKKPNMPSMPGMPGM